MSPRSWGWGCFCRTLGQWVLHAQQKAALGVQAALRTEMPWSGLFHGSLQQKQILDFSPMDLLQIKHSQKSFRQIFLPLSFAAAESKPCSLVFSPLLEVQPQAPSWPDPGTSWEHSSVLSTPSSS